MQPGFLQEMTKMVSRKIILKEFHKMLKNQRIKLKGHRENIRAWKKFTALKTVAARTVRRYLRTSAMGNTIVRIRVMMEVAEEGEDDRDRYIKGVHWSRQ